MADRVFLGCSESSIWRQEAAIHVIVDKNWKAFSIVACGREVGKRRRSQIEYNMVASKTTRAGTTKPRGVYWRYPGNVLVLVCAGRRKSYDYE